MARISTATFKGKSGTSYKFNVYPLGTPLKEVGGIYCITRRSKNAQGEYTHKIIYVGRTEDFSARFDDHHKAECFAKYDANCICTHREDDHDFAL